MWTFILGFLGEQNLLAVEGGEFFSASASGYSKGLTLLLLGKKKEDKPIRVSPWNQYKLVDEEPYPDLQLASTKNQISRRCSSFVCFGRTSPGLDPPSPLKAAAAQQQDDLPGYLVSDKGKVHISELDDGNSVTRIALKSGLKKPLNASPFSAQNTDENEPYGEEKIYISGHTGRRKIQWIDACGSDLVEIREFEPSEKDGSDGEFENGNERSCTCKVM